MVGQRGIGLDVMDSQSGVEEMAMDMKALGVAFHSLAVHATAALSAGFGLGTIFQWLAVIAAVYLLILDRTNWRTNLLTALLVPYIALNMPGLVFGWLRGEVGAWIAFVAVIVRLFFASTFPQTIHGDLELPAAVILLIKTAPSLVSVSVRDSIFGDIISLIIGAYLLYQHLSEAGGFRRALGEPKGVSHTIGILLLFIAPLYSLII